MRYAFGDCELDEERFELRRGGATVELQPKALELLLYLARQGDRLVSKRELLDAIWPGVSVGESSLTRLVSLARRAIGDRRGERSSIATVSGRGYRWLARAHEPSGAHAGRAAPGSLAVLPFADRSAERDQEYLAQGLAEDLVLRLLRFRWFPVISAAAADPSHAHGARYRIEGSVQRAGDRVRITARLSDAATGHQLWSQRHERRLRDVFALQDEITEAIVAAIEPELWASESERAAAAPAHNLDVWQAVQRGWWHLGRGSAEDDARARELCARAVALDPPLARALYGLAGSAHCDAALAWAGSGEAPGVVDAEAGTPLEALGAAAAHARTRRRGRMREAIERAIRLDPDSALACRWLGVLLGCVSPDSHGPDALARIRELAVALAHFRCGRLEPAARAPAHEADPEWTLGFALRVASAAHAGRLHDARALLADVLDRKRELGFEGLAPLLALADREVHDRLEAGLRLAGWPQ